MSWEDLIENALGTIMGALGKSATYSPAAGGAIAINGIFQRGYLPVVFNGVETSSFAITFAIKLSDLPGAPTKDDQVEISGTSYKVIKSEDDGQGGAILFLHEL